MFFVRNVDWCADLQAAAGFPYLTTTFFLFMI